MLKRNCIRIYNCDNGKSKLNTYKYFMEVEIILNNIV